MVVERGHGTLVRGGEAFRGARCAHATVGSATDSLEHRGLDRVRGHGKEGLAGAVALAVPAANVHRPGLMLRERERPVLSSARGHPLAPETGRCCTSDWKWGHIK